MMGARRERAHTASDANKQYEMGGRNEDVDPGRECLSTALSRAN